MTEGEWGKGYSQSELDRAQEMFGLVFPPDLIALLRERRPLKGHVWTDEAAIRRMLEWPFESLLFCVEQDQFWRHEWGARSIAADARKEILQAAISRAPKLLPLISHRYLPEEPYEAGNPVFSVYGSDVIYYGSDLSDYFKKEFEAQDDRRSLTEFKYIRFWSDLVEGDEEEDSSD